MSWNVVEKRIRKLIEEDKYLSPEGKEAYAQYRVEQEQKALEQAQAKMEHETKVACKNAIEKQLLKSLTGIVCQRIQRKLSFRNMALNG